MQSYWCTITDPNGRAPTVVLRCVGQAATARACWHAAEHPVASDAFRALTTITPDMQKAPVKGLFAYRAETVGFEPTEESNPSPP